MKKMNAYETLYDSPFTNASPNIIVTLAILNTSLYICFSLKRFKEAVCELLEIMHRTVRCSKNH